MIDTDQVYQLKQFIYKPVVSGNEDNGRYQPFNTVDIDQIHQAMQFICKPVVLVYDENGRYRPFSYRQYRPNLLVYQFMCWRKTIDICHLSPKKSKDPVKFHTTVSTYIIKEHKKFHTTIETYFEV